MTYIALPDAATRHHSRSPHHSHSLPYCSTHCQPAAWEVACQCSACTSACCSPRHWQQQTCSPHSPLDMSYSHHCCHSPPHCPQADQSWFQSLSASHHCCSLGSCSVPHWCHCRCSLPVSVQ